MVISFGELKEAQSPCGLDRSLLSKLYAQLVKISFNQIFE
jgi:hypothetical protein